MAQYKKVLAEAFKPHFKEQGFTKKDATWHLLTTEAIHVFNIQTSQWGEQYYFNAGIYFRALGSSESPPNHHCHIRTRIPDDKFHPASVNRANELADFDHIEFGAEERIIDLKNLIYPLVFDWFGRFRDPAYSKRELTGIGRPWFAVTGEVWPMLGLELPR